MGAGVPLDGTSAGILVGVLMGYVLISLIVEVSLENLHHHIHHHWKRKEVFLQVFEKVKDEIMLVGVLTILLLLVEEDIVSVCINEACHGIPNTRPACDTSAVVGNSSARRMLLGASSSGPAITCNRFQNCCPDNTVGFPHPECSATGQHPFISIKALHDIHFYIFGIMLTHIAVTMMVMVGATKRVGTWKAFEEEGDGAVKSTDIVKPVVYKNKFLCSCQTQLHESVDSFTFIAVKISFLAQNKGDEKALKDNTGGKGFSFFEELMKDNDHGYIELIGVSWWMWMILSCQLALKAYLFDFGYGVYMSVFIILIAGSKLDRIKAQMCEDIFELADVDHSGDISVAEFEKLQSASDEITEKLKKIEPTFWRKDPDIVLYMIRMVIWLNSTEFGTTIFFIMKTGFTGCYVSQRTWAWIIINSLVTTVVAVHCAYNVIPLYSLTSNLGRHKKTEEESKHHKDAKKKSSVAPESAGNSDMTSVPPAAEGH